LDPVEAVEERRERESLLRDEMRAYVGAKSLVADAVGGVDE
jgi:dsRNA-specific ribonuclease